MSVQAINVDVDNKKFAWTRPSKLPLEVELCVKLLSGCRRKVCYMQVEKSVLSFSLLQFGYVTFLLVYANKVILYMCSIEYRQLSFLREKFKVGSIPGLKHQIPIMALTATATPRVRDDILKSLGIATGKPKIVLTTFFRPNLHFSVSRTEDYLTLTI